MRGGRKKDGGLIEKGMRKDRERTEEECAEKTEKGRRKG